jgi:homoserine kinase
MHAPSVLLKVPGSTSNLGSGFDTLGLAVQLYCLVRVTRADHKGLGLISRLPDAQRLPLQQMLSEAKQRFFRRAGCPAWGVRVELSGNLPAGRGLGASAAARLGVVAGLNALSGTPLSRMDLLTLVTELEGHPDNASPAVFGGFTVSSRVGKRVCCLPFPVSPRLRLVTLIPRYEMKTDAARRLLPATYTRADAAHALNRAALIGASFARRRYEVLRGLFDDRFHQPYREPLIPQLSKVIRAGEKAGAIGGFLSGSGSAIICLALRHYRAVGCAMQRALPDADLRILAADNQGYRVLRQVQGILPCQA